MLQSLKHENILPLYGVTSDFGPYNSSVYPWQENGNLNEYLKSRGAWLCLSERYRIVRSFQLFSLIKPLSFDMPQLSDVSAGISYRESRLERSTMAMHLLFSFALIAQCTVHSLSIVHGDIKDVWTLTLFPGHF